MEKQEEPGKVLRQALDAAILGLANGKITSRASNAIVMVSSDWNKILKHQLRYMKLSHKMKCPRIGQVSTMAPLLEALSANDSEGILTEAKRIRAEFKPIIEAAKARVEELRDLA